VYRFWHGHIAALLADARPDVDAEVIADLLLAGLNTEPILRLLERGESQRLAACCACRQLACSTCREWGTGRRSTNGDR
jgi:hypothetical protein